jgi:hypothetical protein
MGTGVAVLHRDRAVTLRGESQPRYIQLMTKLSLIGCSVSLLPTPVAHKRTHFVANKERGIMNATRVPRLWRAGGRSVPNPGRGVIYKPFNWIEGCPKSVDTFRSRVSPKLSSSWTIGRRNTTNIAPVAPRAIPLPSSSWRDLLPHSDDTSVAPNGDRVCRESCEKKRLRHNP